MVSQRESMLRQWQLRLAVVTVWLAAAGPLEAQAPYADPSRVEGWAWSQVRQTGKVDFNDRCNKATTEKGVEHALDARTEDKRWAEDCRRLPASFLVDILTRLPWRDELPIKGVTIVGARLEGAIDLRNARLARAFVLRNCRVESDILLDAATTDDLVEITESRIAGVFSADGFHTKRSLNLRVSEFRGPVWSNETKIDGRLDMSGVTLHDIFQANGLQVGASLWMRSFDQNKATLKNVVLIGAKAARNIDMTGATVDGDWVGDGLEIGSSLVMRSAGVDKATFKGVVLRSARVARNVDMDGATVDGEFDGDSLQVGNALWMRSSPGNAATFKGVFLRGARITGNLEIIGAAVDGDVEGDGLEIGSSLFMRSEGDNKATFKGVILRGAKVARNIDMDGAIVEGELNGDG